MKPSFHLRGESAFIFEDIIDKALALLNRQFDVDLRYVEKPSLDENSLYKIQVIESNFITYTVSFDQIFKGILELRFKNKLNIKEINKINTLLTLSIKGPSQFYERHLLLNELQVHLQKQMTFNDNNIVNLNYFKNLKNLRNQNNDDFNIIRKSHPPIYIEGLNQEDKKNLALELHYYLGYKAFVHYEDIDSGVSSYKDLLELCGTTIFIENFETLNVSKKLLLLDFLTESNIEDKPLIISSSNIDYAFLLRDTLDRTLLKFLSIYHIRLNKSLNEIKEDGFTTFLSSILKDPKIFTTH